LNDQGITIVMVTHEPDVAQYCKRVVDVRDGRIKHDHPVEDRHNAAADLRELLETEPEDEVSELVTEEVGS
jgi:putative ABC transport system ATP-binding protein